MLDLSEESASMSSPAKIKVVMFGARRHYAVPRILNSGGILERFYTDITSVQGWPRLIATIPSSLLPKSLRRLKGRVPDNIPIERISSFPVFGLQNYLRLAKTTSLEERLRTYEWAAKKLSTLILDIDDIDGGTIYTFCRVGLELMQQVKYQGGLCIMEQTVAPFTIDQKLLLEEQEQFPSWASSVDTLPDPSWFADREKQEWELADLIICGSEYVREGIKACGGPAERCKVVPYGIDGRL